MTFQRIKSSHQKTKKPCLLKQFGCLVCTAAVLALLSLKAHAQTITWQGYTWTLKSGAGLGPGPNEWNASNVFVDSNGYLHLNITYNSVSGAWDCAELYTTKNLGFGTYQWQVEGRIDTFDPWVVLGLFPYAGPDGRNEIDIEYSLWGTDSDTNGWWTVYPATGKTIGQKTYSFSLTGTYTTSRFTWSSSGVQYWLMGGFQSIGTTNNVINSWSYSPTKPANNIPQEAMPLHMNLWLYQGHAPSNGQSVEVIIHSFTKE